MRAFAVATILMLSTSPAVFAQQTGPSSPAQTTPAPSQPQTVPVEPQRTPQQSDQAKKEEREHSEDVQIGQGWRAHEGPGMGEDHADMRGRMSEADMARMMQHMRMCHEMMERMGRRGHEDNNYGEDRASRDDRSYGDEYRRGDRRRVRICIEDEDGEEYCRYRR